MLQVLPALETGGVERGTLEIAEALVQAGARALVASAGGRMVTRLERLGAVHVTLPLDRKGLLAIRYNRRALERVLRKECVDLVHARSRAPAWSARGAARRGGVPFVTTWHGTYSEGFPLKRRYNGIMASGDVVIAISKFIAAEIARRHRNAAERVVVVPRGVDLERFDPAAVAGGRLIRLQEAWRIGEETRVILLPGRLTRWKGQRPMIEAFARYVHAHPHEDVVCVLLGDDQGRLSYRDELVRRARSLGIADRIVLPGEVDDVPAALKLADVVVSASTEPEAFGRVVAEAGAMAKPVIAPAHGAAPEIVEVGETGFLVPPRDVAALAAALEDVMGRSYEERTAMGAKARARVAAHFATTTMCDSTLRIYARLLEQRH